jgi:HK97 family phage prohead protease
MQFKYFSFKTADEKDGIFEGYASTWDVDEGGDQIVKGAFTKTIGERGSKIRLLYQHRDPIGKPIELKEDDRGLFVRAKISDTALGRDVLTLIRDGALDSMSIG